MPKVKIIYTKYAGDYYDDELITGALDWEEVTDEELTLLRTYYHRLPVKNDGYAKLVVQSTEPISESITSIREWLKKEEEREKAAAKKALEAKKVREAKKLEDKRKQLEKLKKELGES